MINPFRSSGHSADSKSLFFHSAHSPLPETDSAVSLAHRLSMSQVTTARWSFLEDVVNYRRLGISRMAIWRPKLIDVSEECCQEAIRESGVQVSSLGWGGGFTGTNGHSFVEAVHDTRSAIVTAAALGAESLTIISGPQGAHIGSHARRLLVEGIAECLDTASEHGVTLAVQPMHRLFRPDWTFLHTLDATLDLLEQFDHPLLKMAFGTYHLWREPDLLERIPSIVPLIASVQVSDWKPNPRCDNDRALPGDGEIPLPSVLQAFEDAGYRGSYEMEIWSRDHWKSDTESLVTTCRDRFGSLLEGVVPQ